MNAGGPAACQGTLTSRGWKKVTRAGGQLSRVCGLFELSFYPHLADGSTIKMLEECGGRYLALVNAQLRGPDGHAIPGQAGLGDTMEQALNNAIELFDQDMQEHIRSHGPLTVDDLVWTDPHGF